MSWEFDPRCWIPCASRWENGEVASPAPIIASTYPARFSWLRDESLPLRPRL